MNGKKAVMNGKQQRRRVAGLRSDAEVGGRTGNGAGCRSMKAGPPAGPSVQGGHTR